MNRYLALVILTAILILGCSEPFVKQEDKQVFRYNEASGIGTLDPAFARDQAIIWGCNQLFNGLVELDNDLVVQPSLAYKWIVSDNGLQYDFYIRNDVYFHDNELFTDGVGRKCTPDDIVWSLKRVLHPKTLSPGAVWLQNIVKQNSDGYAITAHGDSLVRIQLKTSFSSFLGRLSMKYFSVVPHEVVEHYRKDFGRHPVGTGPFYLKMWKEGVKIVMLKNPKHWEIEDGVQLPYLDAISISFIIDKQSAFLEFAKGNIDFVSGIDPSYQDELLQQDGTLKPKYVETVDMRTSPYLNTEYLGFLMDTELENVLQSPTQIKKIRKAINYGFDRHKMIRYLRNNIGIPGEYGFVPPGMPYLNPHKSTLYSFQPDSSRRLLKEAGFPYGKGLPVIKLATTSAYLDLCKFMQNELSELGIKIEIEVHQPAALRTMMADLKMPFFRGSWIADYADPENYMALFYSPNFSPKGSNYTHFSNAEFDQLYVQARSEVNDSIRAQLYQQMDALLMKEAPVVVLYYDLVLRFTHKNISGLGVNAMNLLDLKRVRKLPPVTNSK